MSAAERTYIIRSPRAYLRDFQIADATTTIATSMSRMIIIVCTKPHPRALAKGASTRNTYLRITQRFDWAVCECQDGKAGKT